MAQDLQKLHVLSGVSDGYFNRLAKLDEFKGYLFRTDTHSAYIAEKPDDKKEKPTWKLIGYFVALSDAQNLKKRTFDNVRRIIFDEAILERSDVYHRYLNGEFLKFANLIDTVSRERADDLECIYQLMLVTWQTRISLRTKLVLILSMVIDGTIIKRFYCTMQTPVNIHVKKLLELQQVECML